ncbi:putative integral membrane protein [Frankia sp. AiPs1]
MHLALVVLVVLCAVPLVVTLTASRTVLNPSFYSQSLNRADAYDRLYTEVLPDPAVNALLAGLPIDSSLITANLRTVLPPATVEALTDEQFTRIVDYLRGSTNDVELAVDLAPIFGNVSGLANRYIAGELGSGSTYPVTSVADFTQDVLTAINDIAAGRPPTSLPTIELTAQDADRVLPLLLDRVDRATRTQVEPRLRALLREGDVAGALALIGPQLFQGDERATARMRQSLHGSTLDLGVRLSDLRDQPAITAVDHLHDLTPLLTWFCVLLAVLLAAALVGIVALAGRRGLSRVRAAAGAVVAAGLALGVVGVLLRLVLPNPLRPLAGPHSPLPPGASAVLVDFSRQAYRTVEADYLRIVGWTLALGVVMGGLSFLVSLSARWGGSGRRRRLATAFALAVPVMISVTWTAFPGSAAEARRMCESSPSLCDRRYDQVTYLATHNAMANSEDRFLGPSQDPTIVHQLDLGVRTLLVDVHHWTPAEQVASYLATLPPTTRAALEPLTRGAVSQRPGVWLCHDVCQLGALDYVAALGQIRDWMNRNPTEVVTLIVQDNDVPASEIAGGVAAAGLAGMVATPPDDPHGRWPTLGSMIGSGRRLVIFTEQQDLPGTFLRGFYRYASDTPFDAKQPADLVGCPRNRGSAGSSLLLMNNWITATAPSRQAALTSNNAGALGNRAQRCRGEQGRTPTFIAVDFSTIGSAQAAVDRLNGVSGRSGSGSG